MTEVSDLSESHPVSLERAGADRAPLIANLLELYIHDLSEVFSVKPGLDGRFGYDKLPLYWSEPDKRWAFLIKFGDQVAGFALVTRGSPATCDPMDLDVAEFFVLRGYRRLSVGRQAAKMLWDSLPGNWVVRVSEGNRRGLPFWRAVCRAYASGACEETTRPGNPHGWRVFTFAASVGQAR